MATPCDSQIYQERRVILSSIIKVYLYQLYSKVSNRTERPLIILDADAIETNKFNSISKIGVDQEFYLPIQLLYLRTRLYFSIQQ